MSPAGRALPTIPSGSGSRCAGTSDLAPQVLRARRAPSRSIPSSLQSGCRGCQEGSTTLISPSKSSLQQGLELHLCPSPAFGADGICRGPRFPFPQHKCSVYFLFPLRFPKSFLVLGHSSPCSCPQRAPSCLCPDLPHQLGSLLLLEIPHFSPSVGRDIQSGMTDWEAAPGMLCSVFFLLVPNSNPSVPLGAAGFSCRASLQ